MLNKSLLVGVWKSRCQKICNASVRVASKLSQQDNEPELGLEENVLIREKGSRNESRTALQGVFPDSCKRGRFVRECSHSRGQLVSQERREERVPQFPL